MDIIKHSQISLDTSNNGKFKILVCYYQPWEIVQNDLFFPIQAGKAISGFNLKMQGDDTGDNISSKNATFSEFTAWYWAWKNIKNYFPDIEYIGLSHYRRFFSMEHKKAKDGIIHTIGIPPMLNYEKLFIDSLHKSDIILAVPEYFEYDLRTQYSYYHNSFDYLLLKDIIHEIYPDYYSSFIYIFEKQQKISLYCMFASKYELFDNYFTWLFPLLFKLEQKIDISNYSEYQKRLLAFLAERLLNVYVYHHKLKIKYNPIFFICKDNKELEKRTKKQNTMAKIKEIIKMFIPYGIIKYWENIRNRNDSW